jgi:glycerate 2-kinase
MPDGKRNAREIFEQTLASISIPRVIGNKVQFEGTRLALADGFVDIAGIEKIQIVAVGKAAHAMVEGLSAVLPRGISLTGVVSAPARPVEPVSGLSYFLGGHPLPNADSWRAAEAILELLGASDERTLVFFLLSGGGSALLELPLAPGMQLEDVRVLNRALVTCGAPIDAVNTVRKHVSAVKGGRLAIAAGGAKKITLAVTDVPSGKEWALASGPTLPDPTTCADVLKILAEYDLRKSLPTTLLQWLDDGKMPETPKANHRAFSSARFALILGMRDLFHSAHHAGEAHGYVTRCDNSTDDWPIEQAVDSLLQQLEEWKGANPGQRVALIADGEVSSPVTGKGIGGRNSAFVLACVRKISGRNISVLSAGTDGIDGNSPAAGAVADGNSLARAKAMGMDAEKYFQQSAAYTFFTALDDAIVTGPTNNNLRDLRVLLAEP